VSIAQNIEFFKRLRRMNGMALEGMAGLSGSETKGSARLIETTSFGPNPGDLRMLSYVPADMDAEPALVVVLHGCKQNAAGYDLGAGWSTLADHYGFALLMPEQKSSNNANGCFNWFVPDDIARGSGEARSIRQMVEHMAHQHHVDPDRIFITGLSAGGAMSAVMLATYPEVFAAGAIIAGLPYGIATNVREALGGMSKSSGHSARALGDLVRNASSHTGPWPRLSVWHGSADRTVHPDNADDIVQQWLNLHELPPVPMSKTIVDGHPRHVWWNGDGATVVESYTIADMAHGTPLGAADNDERYGEAGAYLLEAGISSSYRIAQFFGLTGQRRQAKQPSPAKPAPDSVANLPEPAVSYAFKARAASDRRGGGRKQTDRRGIDVNAVITKALTAAGLMK
jgi:poly(hydroxyalkanoate) depolymerase family esterase